MENNKIMARIWNFGIIVNTTLLSQPPVIFCIKSGISLQSVPFVPDQGNQPRSSHVLVANPSASSYPSLGRSQQIKCEAEM